MWPSTSNDKCLHCLNLVNQLNQMLKKISKCQKYYGNEQKIMALNQMFRNDQNAMAVT